MHDSLSWLWSWASLSVGGSGSETATYSSTALPTDLLDHASPMQQGIRVLASGLAMVLLYTLFECIRWRRIKRSLERNRLAHFREYSAAGFVQNMEACADMDVLRNLVPSWWVHDEKDDDRDRNTYRKGQSQQPYQPHQQQVQKAQTPTAMVADAVHRLPQQIVTEIVRFPERVEELFLSAMVEVQSFGRQAVLNVAELDQLRRIASRMTIRALKRLLPIDKQKRSRLLQEQTQQRRATSRAESKAKARAKENWSMVNNLTMPIHVMWTPAFFDLIMCGYMYWGNRRLAACGFRLVDAWHRDAPAIRMYRREPIVTPSKTASLLPPIIFLHGIGPGMSWLPDIAPTLDDRVLLFPLHAGLDYSLRWSFAAGEIMTTLQYVGHICDYLEAAGIRELDVVAWSFGGLVRNYLHEEFVRRHNAGMGRSCATNTAATAAASGVAPTLTPPGRHQQHRFRREVMIEPLGLPVSNAVGSTYNLLPLHTAWQRASRTAPNGSRLHHLLLLLYLRYHVHVRPLSTDPFHNSHSQSQKSDREHTWNHRGMLVLLSRDDVITDHEATVRHISEKCPLCSFESADGVHGTFPVRWLRLSRRLKQWLGEESRL